TPEAWKSTVARMATRSTTLNPINESEQWSVIAYLIAISPTLREGVSDQQAESIEDSENWNAARQIAKALPATLDVEAAEKLFLKKCSQCHSPLLVEHVGLKSQDDAVALVTRMVANGLAANDVEMGQIMAYLAHRFSDNQNP
ncbi:MAG: hypothetical protein P8L32_04510, partial [Paracoccaceae bacterium]|nr:hypothetical protein [Paracoccaceae bacterium]